jgi:hypothetical protein
MEAPIPPVHLVLAARQELHLQGAYVDQLFPHE